ncbi:MAG TPA: hypothetical protein VFS66_13380 [Acidimicrobiia bacterium]|nr:hypothetical protein [Acidimicrobiia bacterium]
MSRRITLTMLAMALAVAVVYPALAWAGDSGGEATDVGEVERPITGPDLDKASSVALAHLGGGVVTETEIEDEESYYEIEVTLEDGRQVDVQLAESFQVVSADVDIEED